MLKSLINFIDNLPVQLYRIMLVITTMVICYLAFSNISLPTTIDSHDKLSHMAAFFVLAWLVMHALSIKRWQQLILLMGFGVFIELVQSKIPTRFSGFDDLFADLIGVLCFWITHWLIHTYLKNKKLA